jgi:hypothetical protein
MGFLLLTVLGRCGFLVRLVGASSGSKAGALTVGAGGEGGVTVVGRIVGGAGSCGSVLAWSGSMGGSSCT